MSPRLDAKTLRTGDFEMVNYAVQVKLAKRFETVLFAVMAKKELQDDQSEQLVYIELSLYRLASLSDKPLFSR